MSSISLVTLFLPAWALPWAMVLAVAAWITGARAVAAAAGAVVAADLVIAPLIAPLIGILPLWVFLLMLALFALGILHRVVSMLYGPETAGTVTGGILLGALRVLVLAPFRFVGWLIRFGPGERW